MSRFPRYPDIDCGNERIGNFYGDESEQGAEWKSFTLQRLEAKIDHLANIVHAQCASVGTSNWFSCEICGGRNHDATYCRFGSESFGPRHQQESLNFVSHFPTPQYNPYPDTHNYGWQDYPNYPYETNHSTFHQSRDHDYNCPDPSLPASDMEDRLNMRDRLLEDLQGKIDKDRREFADNQSKLANIMSSPLNYEFSGYATGLPEYHPIEQCPSWVDYSMFETFDTRESESDPRPDYEPYPNRPYAALVEDDETFLAKEEELPPKLSDSGKFSVSSFSSDSACHDALCDIVSSVNAASLSLIEMLDLGNLRPLHSGFTLADLSVEQPVLDGGPIPWIRPIIQ